MAAPQPRQQARQDGQNVNYISLGLARQCADRMHIASVIGVVVHANTLLAVGGKYNTTIRLVDHTLATGNSSHHWEAADWLGTTFLNSNPALFPVASIGDVILIRNARTVSYEGYTRLCIYPDHAIDWVHLPLEHIAGFEDAILLPQAAFLKSPDARLPNVPENACMLELALWSQDQLDNPAVPCNGNAHRRFGERCIQPGQ